MQHSNQIVVIGEGPAGRKAAARAVRLGADVALIAENVDPSARLDHAAIRFLAVEAERVAQAWSPEGPAPGPEYAPAMRETLVGALEIAARNFDNEMAELQDIGVRVIQGRGCISAPDVVSVTRPGGQVEYVNCRSMILAPGARPFFNSASPRIITPVSMPSLQEVPESLIVLGSSTSGLELAHFFSSYGVQVTVVGARRPALDFLDRDLREKVVASAADNGVQLLTEVTAVTGTTDDHVDLLLTDSSHTDADYVLPCGEGGYRTEGLGLERPGVRTGPDGEIAVDERMQTNIPEIFAVGSITGCYTHNIAIRQAEAAAHNALGGEVSVNYGLIPAAAWFDPQIGTVGLAEEEAGQSGISAAAFTVYFAPGPTPERCAKLVADGLTGRILGLHAVGNGAAEMAHLGALAVHAGVTLNDIAELSCVKGTMAECVSTAAALGRQPIPQIISPLVTGPEQ